MYIDLPEARWNPSRMSSEQCPSHHPRYHDGNEKKSLLSTEDLRRLSRKVLRLTFALVGRVNGDLQQAP